MQVLYEFRDNLQVYSNRKTDTRLVDLKNGTTYYIDKNSIKASGELTVFNAKTERPFTYAKIHALETATSQIKKSL